ncbi:MAG: hypothetical protein OFPII_21340 [Osedax symbiont Rs1]|nr:MAG: hypothetical protein OFPII_21340 [Osedax symbiont Rs1]
MKKNISKVVLFTFLMQTIFSPVMARVLDLPQLPLQVNQYVEPNVMLLVDTSGSMTDSPRAGGALKKDTLKAVATELVKENKNIRFCLAKFRKTEGSTILSACGSSAAQIKSLISEIASLPRDEKTPLAEAYYEVINYFAGKTPKYIHRAGQQNDNDDNIYVDLTADGKYVSPVKHRCQRNYTMIMTDGEAEHDTYFPDFPDANANEPTTKYTNSGPKGGKSGNYDNVDNDIVDDNGTDKYFFLDDMAKYAWDIDLRVPGQDNADKDLSNKSFNDAKFSKQNLVTFTIGFDIDYPMLREAAYYGNGGKGSAAAQVNTATIVPNYFHARNRAELKKSFQAVVDKIANENKPAAAAVSSSERFLAGLLTFQTRFKSNEWTGELLAFEIVKKAVANGGISYSMKKKWSAEPVPSAPADAWKSRVVYTAIGDGKLFKWSNLTATEKPWFADTGQSNGNQQRLDYIRGETANEQLGSDFRQRSSLMGDIINSTPVYVAEPESADFSSESPVFQDSYKQHLQIYKNREKMIYVGANDGMLHGFNMSGQEKMAFVPYAALAKLGKLSLAVNNHHFYVDGSPTVADVYAKFDGVNYSWKTILVGGLRRGGQSIYALDITDPANFSNSEDRAKAVFQWEFSDDDLGYTYSEPQILRLNDGNYYVAVGNGYNSMEKDGTDSKKGEAVLYLLNIADGTVFKKISTGYGAARDPNIKSLNNGLNTITGHDAGKSTTTSTSTVGVRTTHITGVADGKVDYIYAGDLFGNIWKFDLSSNNSADWGSQAEATAGTLNPERNPIKLFTAKDKSGKAQPVTVPITVHTTKAGDIMLYFGTGKLLELKDTESKNVAAHTFYGIKDSNNIATNPAISGRSELLEQKITFQGTFPYANNTKLKEVRATSSKAMGSAHKGWYIDLNMPSTKGEQVVVGARVIENVVYFVTNIADQDVCEAPTKKNFLMGLSAKSGAALSYHNIDTNEDGVIDDRDGVTYKDGNKDIKAKVSGRVGFGLKLPTIIKTSLAGVKGNVKGIICDSDKCHKIQFEPNGNGGAWKRVYWKELRTD